MRLAMIQRSPAFCSPQRAVTLPGLGQVKRFGRPRGVRLAGYVGDGSSVTLPHGPAAALRRPSETRRERNCGRRTGCSIRHSVASLHAAAWQSPPFCQCRLMQRCAEQLIFHNRARRCADSAACWLTNAAWACTSPANASACARSSSIFCRANAMDARQSSWSWLTWVSNPRAIRQRWWRGAHGHA